ncbi:hypothetical protein X875_16760 [Mannheimia varigena USDA-ARS-USMARC-1388]|nr:hypothetical protein X875_16760 [Mannheimia varigena USDA-ARS-USMARC-1388]
MDLFYQIFTFFNIVLYSLQHFPKQPLVQLSRDNKRSFSYLIL